MPVFLRSELIRLSLNSLYNQTLMPEEIIIIDNNILENESSKLKEIVDSFNRKKNIIKLFKSTKNSGAVARNIGVRNANCDLVAFLDSDVVLDKNYYEILIKYFINDSSLIAIQGTDRDLIKAELKRFSSPIYKRFLHYFEQFFETSTLLCKKYPYVSSSLAISHPDVTKDFCLETEWISTCAGIFKRKLFLKYSFPEQFVTYSNNEYLFFSYRLFLNKEGRMIYTSKAKYENIPTEEGRLSQLPLIYQIEVNDLFIFLSLFPKNGYNLLNFLKSRFGHLLNNVFKSIKNKKSILYLLRVIWASIYPFIHLKEIIKKDLKFYENDFL